MYTKYTIVTFAKSPVDIFDNWTESQIDFINDAFEKSTALADRGVTPGHHEAISDNKIKRLWLDQSSAEDWKEFMLAISKKYAIVIDSVDIFDNLD
jgi:hypothetical protein